MFLFSSCDSADELVYKNPEAQISDRVEDLLARMTLEEKVSQMRMFHAQLGIKLDKSNSLFLSDNVKQRLENGIGGIKNPGEHNTPEDAARLNNLLQKYIITNNRLGIPAFFVTESYNGVDAEGCTRFERPISLAASWNKALVNRVYDVMGREARLRGLHLTHSPVADIARDPRFGRMSEGFGEDTYLSTEMIVKAVTGIQGDFDGLKNTHIGAVTKHFAGYAQVAGGTNFAAIEISPRTLIDEILPPFKAAVQRANSLGIMASHGDLNGIASHANPWLLKEVLRDQWGFKGYTISDANDIGRLHYFMHVAETPEDAVRMALVAGMDVDLYADDAYALLPDMVRAEPELEVYVDSAVSHVLRTKFILGLFDNPYQNPEDARIHVRDENAVDLAHQADLESIILLKNENETLPIHSSGRKSLALVGPLLNDETVSAFKELAGDQYNIISEKGFKLTNEDNIIPELTSENEMLHGINKILNKTKYADIIIAFIGGDEYTSKEAFFNGALGDRETINPVGLQDKLLEELKQTGKPLIAVVKHRRTLSVNAATEHADAILDCWELSEFGDKAIAKTIFGHVNPSGKLPVTVPHSIGYLPYYYSQKEINYKKGYLFAENKPLFSFGFGLSYTTFDYSNLQVSDSVYSLNDSIMVSVDVKNIGTRAGKEVVQLYIKDLIGSVVRPDKELKGFYKIFLEPGEKKSVLFALPTSALTFTGIEMKPVIEEGDYHALVGGSSDQLSMAPFRITK